MDNTTEESAELLVQVRKKLNEIDRNELTPGTASKEVSTLTMPQMSRVLRALGVKKDVCGGLNRDDRISTIRELMVALRSDEVASVLLRQQNHNSLKRRGESDDKHKRRKMRKAHHVGAYISRLFL